MNEVFDTAVELHDEEVVELRLEDLAKVAGGPRVMPQSRWWSEGHA